MEVKILEIRDHATMIPVLCVNLGKADSDPAVDHHGQRLPAISLGQLDNVQPTQRFRRADVRHEHRRQRSGILRQVSTEL
jgi:hypothetical protein